MITHALEKAFAEAAELPADEQDEFAAWLLDELDERHWQTRFDETGDALDKLADKAIAEYLAGLTEPLDLDNL